MQSESVSHTGSVNSLPLGQALSPATDTQPPAALRAKNAAGDIYATGAANVLVGDNITLQGGTSYSIYNSVSHSSFEKLVQICYELILSQDGDEDTTAGLTFGNGSFSNAHSVGNHMQNSIEHGNGNSFENDLGQSTQKNGIISATELEVLMSSMTKHDTPATPKQAELLETILKRIQPQETHAFPGAPGSNGPRQPSGQSELLTRFQKLMTAKKEERDVKVAQSIREWLLPQKLDQNIYESLLRLKLPNTCNWILDRPQFSQWASPDFASGHAKALWIHGLPGFGKTFLCARIVKYLHDSLDTPVGHFFISSGNASQYDPFLAIRSWLLQAMSHDCIFRTIRRIWKSRRSEPLSQQTTIEIFKAVIQEIPGCTFVLDGLDECGTPQNTGWHTNAEVIDDFLAELWDAISQTKTRILLISRDDPSIRDSIPSDEIDFAEYGISPQDVKSDVLLYARDVVEKKSRKADDVLKEDLAEKMSERCQGQFIWIKFIQSSLSRRSTQDQLETAIRDAPDGMDSFYSRNWTRVMATGSGNIAYAIDTLRWVTFALRPLTVSELVEALMIDLDASELSTQGAPSKIDEDFVENLRERCAGLIEIREITHSKKIKQRATSEEEAKQPIAGKDDIASRTVHLPHHSVKEFLLQAIISTQGTRCKRETEITSEENKEHAKLARLCLQYLNYESTWQLQQVKQTEGLEIAGQKLRSYASRYWYQHIKAIEKGDKETCCFIDKFFATDNSAWDAWEIWSAVNERVLKHEYKIPNGDRIHYACELGLTETVRHLLCQRPDMLETPTPSGQTCLEIACIAGHTAIVEMLVSANANLEILLYEESTIFELACENGHLDILDILLNAKASTVTLDGHCLCIASTAGNVEMVRMLLKEGVDNVNGSLDESTALWFAAEGGHIEVVRLLLDACPNILATAQLPLSPLCSACSEGHGEVVKLLLQRGASIDCVDHEGHMPLHAASFAGHLSIIQLLIANNAQLDVYANGEYAPIHIAAKAGHTDVLKLFLDQGISPEMKTKDGVTPLSLASMSGNINTVQLLLKRNADLSTTCNEGLQPIHLAANRGKTDIVSLLVGHHADMLARNNIGPSRRFSAPSIVEATDAYGWTPLHYAASTNCSETAKLLTERGASVIAVDDKGWTPFHFAASQPNADTIRVLLECGADIHLLPKDHPSPLHLAAGKGQVEIMSLLLERGADVNSTVKEGWTPAHCAVHYHQYEALSFLIEQHVDIAIADNRGQTVMHYAIFNCHDDMVDLLIEAGADVCTADANRVSCIAVASLSGSVKLIQLLLNHGADASQADVYGYSPLMIASKSGHLEAAQLLLASAPSMARELDVMHRSAFFYAATRGHVAIAKLLFATSSDVVTTKDFTGMTALERAARQGYTAVVREISAMLPPSQIAVTLPDSGAENLEPASYDMTMPYCDVCIQNVVAGVYYACVVCMGGDFGMCEKCYENGTKCLDATHLLVKKELPIAQG